MSDQSPAASGSSGGSESLAEEADVFGRLDEGEGGERGGGMLPEEAVALVQNPMARDWFFSRRETEAVLNGVHAVVRLDDRASADDHLRYMLFLRDTATDLFRRLYMEDCVCDWPHGDLAGLLSVTATLLRVTAHLLRDALTPEHVDALISFVYGSTAALDPDSPFHQKTKGWPLPKEFREGGPEGEGAAPARRTCWLQYLVDQFLEARGLRTLIAAMAKVPCLTRMMTERLFHLGARIAPWLGEEDAKELGEVYKNFIGQLLTDPPQPWRSGKDNGPPVCSSVFDSARVVLEAAEGPQEAEEIVAGVQCRMVETFLEDASFAGRIQAVEAIYQLLFRAQRVQVAENGTALQALDDWLTKKGVVDWMVSSQLDKQHYMQQVLRVLRSMALSHILKEQHIDKLWSIIEPEGTFDVLKEHVVELLGELASCLSHTQVQFLLERSRKVARREAADTQRMVGFLGRIVNEDSQGNFAPLVLQSLWDVLLEDDRHTSHVHWDVFKNSMDAYLHFGRRELLQKYLSEAVRELREGQVKLTLLHLFRFLCQASIDYGADEENAFECVVLLIGALQRYREQLESSQQHNTQGQPPERHIHIVREILSLVMQLTRGQCTFDARHFDTVWSCMVEHPYYGSWDREEALRWLSMLLEANAITDAAAGSLLDQHLCSLYTPTLDSSGFECFKAYFCRVNGVVASNDSIGYGSRQGTSALSGNSCIGIDFLWQLLLDSLEEGVAQHTQQLLVALYIHTRDSQSEFRKRCLHLLRENSCKLAGLDTQHLDWRLVLETMPVNPDAKLQECVAMRVARCLEAINSLMQAEASLGRQDEGASTDVCQEEMNQLYHILLYLVDCPCRVVVRETANQVLAGLPPYPPLVTSLETALQGNMPSSFWASLKGALHIPLKDGKVAMPERTKYALQMLNKVLNHGSDRLEHPACITFVLEVVKAVDTGDLKADQKGQYFRELHMCVEHLLRMMARALDKRSRAPAAHECQPDGQNGHETAGTPSVVQVCTSAGDKPLLDSHAAMDLGTSQEEVPTAVDKELKEHPDDKDDNEKPASQAETLSTQTMTGVMKRMQGELTEGLADNVKLTQQTDAMATQTMDEADEAKQATQAMATEGFNDTQMSTQERFSAETMDMDSSLSVDEVPDDQAVLLKVVKHFVQLATTAAAGWGCSTQGIMPSDMDSLLVGQAYTNINKLVRGQPSLRRWLTTAEDVRGMLLQNLVNRQGRVRDATLSFGRLLCSMDAPTADWLFTLLKSEREMADQHPGHCEEYYKLLGELVDRFTGTARDAELADVKKLLFDVLECIRASPADKAPGDVRLGCQLRLVTRLTKALEREAPLKDKEDQLVRFLINELLFPEAWELVESSTKFSSPAIKEMRELLCTRNTSTTSREAAFELLQELMSSSPLNQRLAIELLNRLHFSSRAAEYSGFRNMQGCRDLNGYVGLRNAAATCYMNSVLQQFFMQPSIRDGVLAAADLADDDQEKGCFFYNFQRLLGELQFSHRQWYFPKDLLDTYTHSDGKKVDLREHNDAMEFLLRVEDLVDEHLVRTGQQPVIKKAMRGSSVQQIICRDGDHVHVSETEQAFTNLAIDIRGKSTLQEGLDDYVNATYLEGDNAYKCEQLGKEVPALMRHCIKGLSDTLLIQLKRFELDYETMEFSKLQDRLEFPVEIDMYPYTSTALLKKEGIIVDDGDGDSTCEKGNADWVYELRGVVVHSGTLQSGHYYSLIKERMPAPQPGIPEQPDRWWRFDDHTVQPWDLNKLDDECFGGEVEVEIRDDERDIVEKHSIQRYHNAYLMLYERKGVRERTPVIHGSDEVFCSHGSLQAGLQEPPFEMMADILENNFKLLYGTRLCERAYGRFMLHLLNCMSVGLSSQRRKARKATPTASSTSNSSTSSKRKRSRESSPSGGDSGSMCCDQDGDQNALIRTATLLFDYLMKVFLPANASCRVEEADRDEWERLLAPLLHDNPVVCGIAVEKLVDSAEHIGRCLVTKDRIRRGFTAWLVSRVVNGTVKHHLDHSLIARLVNGICVALERRVVHGVPYGSAAEVLQKCITALGHTNPAWLSAAQLLTLVSSHLARLHFEGEDNSVDDIIAVNSHLALIVRTGCAPHSVGNPMDGSGLPYQIPHTLQDTLVGSRHAVEGMVQTGCMCRDECRELLRAVQWDSSHMSRAVVESLVQVLSESSGEALPRMVPHIVDVSLLDDKFVGDRAKYILKACWSTFYEPYGDSSNIKRLALLEIARQISLRCQMCMDELKSYGKQKLREVYVWLGKLGGVADTQLDQRKQECLLREWLGRLMD